MPAEGGGLEPPAATRFYTPPSPSSYPELQRLSLTRCSLLLASSSCPRRQLLAAAAVPHGVFSPPVDEEPVQQWLQQQKPDMQVGERTALIAHLKADAAVNALRGAHAQQLQQLRLEQQLLQLQPSLRPQLLQQAEQLQREEGKAAAAVLGLGCLSSSSVVLEAAEGRRPLLLTVDTGVQVGSRVLFKPRDAAEADSFLASYSAASEPVLVASTLVVTDLAAEFSGPPLDSAEADSNRAEGRYGTACRACGKRIILSSKHQHQQQQESGVCACQGLVLHAAEVLYSAGGPHGYRSSSRVCETTYTWLQYKEMDAAARTQIIEEGLVLSAAGAIIFEKGLMASFVKDVRGDTYSCVGLSLDALQQAALKILSKTH